MSNILTSEEKHALLFNLMETNKSWSPDEVIKMYEFILQVHSQEVHHEQP